MRVPLRHRVSGSMSLGAGSAKSAASRSASGLRLIASRAAMRQVGPRCGGGNRWWPGRPDASPVARSRGPVGDRASAPSRAHRPPGERCRRPPSSYSRLFRSWPVNRTGWLSKAQRQRPQETGMRRSPLSAPTGRSRCRCPARRVDRPAVSSDWAVRRRRCAARGGAVASAPSAPVSAELDDQAPPLVAASWPCSGLGTGLGLLHQAAGSRRGGVQDATALFSRHPRPNGQGRICVQFRSRPDPRMALGRDRLRVGCSRSASLPGAGTNRA